MDTSFTIKTTIKKRSEHFLECLISTIACVIQVKQGDILGPILFTFFIAAKLITWKATSNVTACIFYGKNNAKLTGRSYRARGEKVLLLDSEYADDQAIFLIIVKT